MKKLIIIIIVFITGCNNINKIPEKPYIIHDIYTNSSMCNEGDTRYFAHGKNGVMFDFCEAKNKYNLGDTIK